MKANYKKYFYSLIAVSFVLVFSSCTETKNTGLLKGKFFNQTFLDEIPGTIAGQISVYAYELNFTGDDSVAISYGFENGKLAVKKDGDSYLLLNAMQGKDIRIKVNKDNSLTLLDSVWTNQKRNSVFFPVSETDSLNHFINEKAIAGTYIIHEKGIATNNKVEFKANGKVSGLRDFETYNICYSGDCTQETLTPSNTITFNAKGKLTTYAFEVDNQNDIVHICNIEPPIEDIKGERKVLNKIYDLKRVKTN